jgi:hypothetical protein
MKNKGHLYIYIHQVFNKELNKKFINKYLLQRTVEKLRVLVFGLRVEKSYDAYATLVSENHTTSRTNALADPELPTIAVYEKSTDFTWYGSEYCSKSRCSTGMVAGEWQRR